jgi:DNA helicase-2/ATP-dependent DNA helicase PcrA
MDLTKLNEKQHEAVTHIEGPALVIAGAGSGKTRVLTNRIAYLIEKNDVSPNKILAITFTNKAANEMKERIAELIDYDVSRMWVGTFHSICVRILRRCIDRLGYSSNFIIFDSDEQKIVVKESILELNLDTKDYDPNSIRSIISNEKNNRTRPDEYIKENFTEFRKRNIGEIYKLYEKKLKKSNALDFDDLLIKTLDIMEQDEEIRNEYRDKFEYILVDEYQDTNKVQYMLVRILGKKENSSENVFVVGDEDQSIYGWRGADINNILDFEKDFPSAKVIKLERNYRSTQTILEAANAVIKNNTNRIGKNLWTEGDEGAKILINKAFDEKSEALFMAERIYNEKNIQSVGYDEMAILVRTRAQTRAIEERMRLEGIPYKIVGGQEFYSRKEIKDLMGYLKLVQNNNENYSFRRVINVPKRGIGKKTLELLDQFAADNDMSLFESAELSAQIGVSKKASESLKKFTDMVNKICEKQGEMELIDLVEHVYEDSGYKDLMEANRSVEGKARLENINEFFSAVRDFQDRGEETELEDFMAHISLLTDIEKTEDGEGERIAIMTVHSAKGLEFDVVFIGGLEENMFPIVRDGNEDDIEEERRLFYVAITRAKKRLYITFAQDRLIYGNYHKRTISRFINEIPEELVNSNKKKIQMEAKKQNKYNLFTGGFTATAKKPMQSDQTPSSSTTAESTASSSAQSFDSNDNKLFKVGDKIQHKKWGTGTIVQVKGDEITAAFDNRGVKTMMMPYAPIKKI